LSRWDVAALSDPRFGDSIRHAGFVHGAQLFDRAHFAISLTEAAAIDPQQRIVLESGAAVLSSRTRAKAFFGDVGVAAGVCYVDWSSFIQQQADTQSVYATLTPSNVISGRLSYSFNLQGPRTLTCPGPAR
jgi:acyl transferase domain-containing protein